MYNLKPIISHNIAQLRISHEMTQLELAEKLNYSDKAVSKWERGESIPDVTVLKEIADLFSVTVDYLLCAEHNDAAPEPKPVVTQKKHNHGFITGMCIVLVWLIAAMAFVVLDATSFKLSTRLLPFLYAIPATFVLWLVLNSVWFNKRRNFFIISLLMWSVLGVLFISFFYFLKVKIPFLFILGIPGQAIILLWSRIKKIRHK